MSLSNAANENGEELVPLATALFILLTVLLGALAAVFALPALLPGLAGSLTGAQPKVYWDLSRISGLIGYVLIWFSIMLGLLVTNKFARVWPGGPLAVELHQFTALLGLAFGLFHGVMLLGDGFINYSAWQLLLPFGSVNYRPFWVGLGQIAFYLMLPVTFSYYVRKRIGYGLWRSLHFGSFAIYALTTVHGLLSGSDTTNPIILGMYAATGVVVFFLTIYRTLNMAQAAQA